MKVLIVDDEKNIRESIAKYLKIEKIDSVQASNGLYAIEALKEWHFDAIILDLKMPEMNGLELLTWIENEGPNIPVIMMSAFGEISDAVEAMKLGAKDYLVKPFNPEELLMRLRRLFDNSVDIQNRNDNRNEMAFIGDSPAIKVVKSVISRVAQAPSNILITGESGTGKEISALMVHSLSNRFDKPFIPVNVGGLPENLLESELFGYEKGAFTGADSRKIGLFEAASGGTLFLDEIGEMPATLQVKLLRVLQDKKITRLGSVMPIPIDIRLIAATNRILENEIRNGNFREDLYYRLNVVRIHLPPLRERKDDLKLLVDYFINKFNIIFNKKIQSISEDALNLLHRYDFPGNIRELENSMERAFIFCDSLIIQENHFSFPEQHILENDLMPLTVKSAEKETIRKALEQLDQNRTKASKILGISRRTLINKIKEYDL